MLTPAQLAILDFSDLVYLLGTSRTQEEQSAIATVLRALAAWNKFASPPPSPLIIPSVKK